VDKGSARGPGHHATDGAVAGRGQLAENPVPFIMLVLAGPRNLPPQMSKPRYLLLGVLLGMAAAFGLSASGQPPVVCKTAAVAVLMAVWWITEAVSIYFTGLLPLILFPLLGILPGTAIAPMYMKEIIFLFIGGFILAYAVERWGLHRRIALWIILHMGASPSRLLAGFMLAGWFLSMWILNTAAATLLLPAALAVLDELRERSNGHDFGLTKPLLLGVAFSTSIGGTATLIGTMPNLILKDFYAQNFPELPELTFAQWFAFGLPLSLFMLLACWLLLKHFWLREKGVVLDLHAVRERYNNLGPIQYEEKVMAGAFGLTILAWFTMADIPFGAFVFPGWVPALGLDKYVQESTIAMAVVGLLFLWPARSTKSSIIGWSEVERIPIGVIFLFGGGFALAAGMDSSGLSEWFANRLSALEGQPLLLIVVGLCLFTTFFTEITSNTATTILMLSLLLPMTQTLHIHPLAIMLPVTITASYAFMLPVATPPNTIVFASGQLAVRDMVRVGIWLNLIGTLAVVAASHFIGSLVFGY